MEVTRVQLTTVGSGVLDEIFEYNFAKILENIGDPNTKAEDPREMTFKIKIKPAENRGDAELEIKSSVKLAGVVPYKGHMFFGKDRNKIVAFEQDTINQPELDNISDFKNKEVK